MDRLARNLDDLRLLAQQLTSQKIKIEFLKEDLTFKMSEIVHQLQKKWRKHQ